MVAARGRPKLVGAELPPPPSLAIECFEHEPQVVDEPKERGGGARPAS